MRCDSSCTAQPNSSTECDSRHGKIFDLAGLAACGESEGRQKNRAASTLSTAVAQAITKLLSTWMSWQPAIESWAAAAWTGCRPAMLRAGRRLGGHICRDPCLTSPLPFPFPFSLPSSPLPAGGIPRTLFGRGGLCGQPEIRWCWCWCWCWCLLFRFFDKSTPLCFRGSKPGIPVGVTSPGARGDSGRPHPDLDPAGHSGGRKQDPGSTSNCFHLLRLPTVA